MVGMLLACCWLVRLCLRTGFVCEVVLCFLVRPEMQWTHLEKKTTGGSHWQSKAMSGSAPWGHTHLAPAPIPVPQMVGTFTL